MTQIKGLTTDLSKEFPQSGTGVHMPPASGLLGELDNRHRQLGSPSPGLLPCSSYTVTSDGFGLRKLCFDLPSYISNNTRPEEVRVVHLWRATSLDHLYIDLLPVLLFREVERTYPLPSLIKKIKVMKVRPKAILTFIWYFST